MNIDVSIIVPVYNIEQFIEEGIRSLLGQTLESIEIIAVDDGSTDRTGNILDQLEQETPDKLKVFHIPNGGTGNARNFGMQKASGKYIGFMDGDDWTHPDMYRQLYLQAEKGNDIVVCNCIRKYFAEDHHVNVIKAYQGKIPLSMEDFIKYAYFSAAPCNKLFRRDLIEKSGLEYPKIPYEDVSFIPALITYASKIKYLDADLYYYRIREGSITSNQGNSDKILYKIEAYKDALKKCNKGKTDLLLYSIVNKLQDDIISFPNYAWYFQEYLVSLLPEIRKNTYLQEEIQKPEFTALFSSEISPLKIHVMGIGRDISNKLIEDLNKNFADFEVKIWTEKNFEIAKPPIVNRAFKDGKFDFVNDYAKLEILYQEGGIAIDPDMILTKKIVNCFKYKVVIGSLGENLVHTKVMVSYPRQDFLLGLIATYHYSPYTNEFLDLSLRIKDYLYVVAHCAISGENQEIEQTKLAIFPPSYLVDDLDSNVCLSYYCGNSTTKDFYRQCACNEYVKKSSRRIPDTKKVSQLEHEIYLYKTSTCWKITRPIRVLGDFIKRKKR